MESTIDKESSMQSVLWVLLFSVGGEISTNIGYLIHYKYVIYFHILHILASYIYDIFLISHNPNFNLRGKDESEIMKSNLKEGKKKGKKRQTDRRNRKHIE